MGYIWSAILHVCQVKFIFLHLFHCFQMSIYWTSEYIRCYIIHANKLFEYLRNFNTFDGITVYMDKLKYFDDIS